jgi:hypothetical protein
LAYASVSASQWYNLTPDTALPILGGGSYSVSGSGDDTVLTLTNVNFSTSDTVGLDLSSFTGSNLTIDLEGDNTISTATATTDNYALYSPNGKVTFQGGGNLILMAGGGTNSTGLYATGLTLQSSNSGAPNVIAIGGSTSQSSTSGSRSYGAFIFSDAAVIGSGSLTAIGGTSPGDGGASYGLSALSIAINSGALTGISSAANAKSYGLEGAQGININGGTVLAKSGDTSNSASIAARVSPDSSISLSGGTITASGQDKAFSTLPALTGDYAWTSYEDADFSAANNYISTVTPFTASDVDSQIFVTIIPGTIPSGGSDEDEGVVLGSIKIKGSVAGVQGKTITGNVILEASSGYSFNLTKLNGYTPDQIAQWFTGMPNGVQASIDTKASSTTSVYLDFSGTPDSAFVTDTLSAVIPDDVVEGATADVTTDADSTGTASIASKTKGVSIGWIIALGSLLAVAAGLAIWFGIEWRKSKIKRALICSLYKNSRLD